MTEDNGSKSIPPMFTDERVLEWMEEHVTELRRSVSGQRILYESLGIGFVVGLAAHIGGYALLASLPREPFGLLADLLHALGWSLWTGVVVAVFVEIIPEVKRRQIREAIDAYESLQRDKNQASGKRKAAVVERTRMQPGERKQVQKANRDRTRKAG
jgi:hypothetical protein